LISDQSMMYSNQNILKLCSVLAPRICGGERGKTSVRQYPGKGDGRFQWQAAEPEENIASLRIPQGKEAGNAEADV